MQEVVWDEELEFFAQCLVNQCEFSHDKCPVRTDEKYFGQILHLGYASNGNINQGRQVV